MATPTTYEVNGTAGAVMLTIATPVGTLTVTVLPVLGDAFATYK